MADTDVQTTEEPKAERKAGRPSVTAIVRESLEDISGSIATINLKIDHLYEKISEMHYGQHDHEARIRSIEQSLATKAGGTETEVRLRALEQATTTIQASRGTASWLWQAVWPVAGVTIAALGYLSK